ncbi:MAG: EAL domain-containing protein [Gammaproteobacteria bacterium]|nr:EAL domain-containing protein [Gammaproteobacteria bacterium]
MNLSTILWVSVALQVFAAIYALRLIPISGRLLAWSILSFAFFLMATRRAISLLYREGYIQNEMFQALTAESVALLISTLIVAGVILIKKIFVEHEKNINEIKTLSQVVEQNPVSTIIASPKGKIQYANLGFLSFMGLSRNDCIGKNIETIHALGRDRETYDEIFHVIESGGDWTGELLTDDQNNEPRWVSARISLITNSKHENDHIVIMIEDISESKKQQGALMRQALHDGLTDLPNRTLFTDRLEQAIHSAQRDNHSLAVLLMDLDHFKEINDTLGHHIGDILLKEIGPKIHQNLRSIDTVARMGGDEFLLLLPNSDEQKSIEVAQKILLSISEPFLVDGHTLEIGASIGIAIYPAHADDPNSLIRRADVAMYDAKHKKSGFNLYDPLADQHNPGRLTMMSELRQAIAHNQLCLYYQPKINLKENKCVGVEALVRWNHPEKGQILPDTFIEDAEKSNTIKSLTQWVLTTAIEQSALWNKEGFCIDMSVNISARDFQDPALLKLIEDKISNSTLEPACLTLELTESAVMTDTKKAFDSLSKLDKMGVKLAIDDFGTGYSSLDYLKRLPVDELKIDRSFVIDMATSKNDEAIVRSTIDLAHNLGLSVVAEGVEDQSSLDLLEKMGCDTMQGYFTCRPLPADEISEYLSKSPIISCTAAQKN